MPVGAYTRAGHPQTSHLAAQRVNVAKSEAMVLEFLRRHPNDNFTTLEITRNISEIEGKIWTVSPRMQPMRRKGLVLLWGKRNAINSNRRMTPQQAWQIAPGVMQGEIVWVVRSKNERHKLSHRERLAREQEKLMVMMQRRDTLDRRIQQQSRLVLALEHKR